MSHSNIVNSYYQVFKAIDNCITDNLLIPCLILIYSAIDSASWLADETGNASVGVRFQCWVNTWMLNRYFLPCSAEELYAARCGLLHTLTPDSDLSDFKGVRRIAYAWGTAKSYDLQESIEILERDDIVAIHIEDLLESFRNGFADFIEQSMVDVDGEEALKNKASIHFANIDIETMNAFFEAARESLT